MGEALTAVFSGVVGAAVVTLLNNVIMFKLNRKAAKEDKAEDKVVERLNTHDEEIKTFREGLTALLHDRIYRGCMDCLKRGKITEKELSNMEYLYKSYHALGGNGTGTELYERCKDLPLDIEGGIHNEKTE